MLEKHINTINYPEGISNFDTLKPCLYKISWLAGLLHESYLCFIFSGIYLGDT